MGWLLEIVHETRLHYQGSARASYNEARMTPLTLPTQAALQTRVTVGNGIPVWAYQDYWGTRVSSFDIQAPHEELLVRSHSMVETMAAPPPPDPLSWAELRGQAEAGLAAEFLAATPRTTVDPALSAAARDLVAGADPVRTAAVIASWVRDRVAYVPGATEVQTGAQEAWDKGEGVCQDIAHLTVALFREAGLPARYVSGYLHPRPEAGIGKPVAGQSHAWVEYWVGTWVAADPTNRAPVGECHVVVARGRDYSDVPPLKGIYHGAPSMAMGVSVEVTRLA
ncbi:MAG: transglutaminase domain-containing protein [Streptosporangiales bacterium]